MDLSLSCTKPSIYDLNFTQHLQIYLKFVIYIFHWISQYPFHYNDRFSGQYPLMYIKTASPWSLPILAVWSTSILPACFEETYIWFEILPRQSAVPEMGVCNIPFASHAFNTRPIYASTSAAIIELFRMAGISLKLWGFVYSRQDTILVSSTMIYRWWGFHKFAHKCHKTPTQEVRHRDGNRGTNSSFSAL